MKVISFLKLLSAVSFLLVFFFAVCLVFCRVRVCVFERIRIYGYFLVVNTLKISDVSQNKVKLILSVGQRDD